MKIAIGNDHAAVMLKNHVVKYLESKGHEVLDLGIAEGERVDYPLKGEEVARKVASGEVDRGIVVCGTGIGISIAANKVHGIRCACVSEPVSAGLCRSHNNCNMIAFGERIVGLQVAEAIVDAFMETEALGDRHARRVELLMEVEARG